MDLVAKLGRVGELTNNWASCEFQFFEKCKQMSQKSIVAAIVFGSLVGVCCSRPLEVE